MPKLTPEALAEMRTARDQGKVVFLRERTPVGQCTNCGGWREVWLQVSLGGPYPHPPAKGIAVFQPGGWWSVESKTYPCPVCCDAFTLIRHLWRGSGIEESERDWRLDYLMGRAGKVQALEIGRTLLAQTPHPCGWYVVNGSYGVGKTGWMKAVVVGFIKAGVSACYRTAEGILAEIRATYGGGEIDESDLRVRYGAFRFLAIDEVDRVSGTEWARSTLFGLLNSRYEKRYETATALATNLNVEELPEGLAYLASRMKAGQRVMVGGNDLREELEF